MGNCLNKAELKSPINEVWETVKDFHDMSCAPEVITSLEVVGDKKGNEVGAKRCLNEAFHETLIKIDNDNYTFSYSIDDGPGPVAEDAVKNYIGVVTLSETPNGTSMEWNSSFDSANENDVVEFCNPIYRALMSALSETLSK